MELSSKGAAFVRKHEGFVGHWYADPVGILTIGIGFTWRSDSFQKWWKKHKPGIDVGKGSMSRAEAEDALIFLCKSEYGAAVNKFLGHPVSQHVFDGMVSPVYNLGPGSLKWKWAAKCERGDYKMGAELLRNTGTTAKGRKLPGLVRRRKEEADLIEHGHYAGSIPTTSKPVDAMADGVLARGERGPAVKALMRDLSTMGLYDGLVDGLFGPGCESAVMEFQNFNGLTADGYAGPLTLAAIASKLKDQPAPAPKREIRKARNAEKVTVAALLTTAVAAIAIKWHEFTAWVCEFLPFCQ